VKDALKGGDADAIKGATSALESSLESLYNAAQQAQAGMGGNDAASAPHGEAPESDEPRQAKGKVVDAEVVD
jgi:molecular chaperone DnaK